MADNPFADLIPQRGANPFADLIPAGVSAPEWSDAITDIPSEIGKSFNDGYENLTRVAGRGQQGQIEGLLNTGRAVLAVPQMALSPLTGAARSIGGHLLEQATHAAGRVIAPEIAAKEDRRKNYETAKGDVDLAMMALGSRGAVPVAAVRAPVAAPEVVQAADRLSAATGIPINVPNAIASDNIAVQRVGQGIRNIPVVGDAIPQATQGLVENLGVAVRNVAGQYGSGSGPNVANRVGRQLAEAADAETAAARAAAQRSDDALLADWQRSTDAAGQNIAAREESALQRARQSVGDMSPQDMGEVLISRLRQGEREARANKERLYGIAGETGGSIHPDALPGLRSSVMRSLDENGVIVDPVVNGHSLTPAAARMVAELERVPVANIGERAPQTAARERGPVAERAQAKPTPVNNWQAPERADSLLEFLAKRGGLGPDAELAAIGGDGHVVNVEGVGRRKLVRQGGLPLDYAREAAEEAGYLRGDHRGTSSVRDFLDAVDAEMRGQKRFPEGLEGSLSKRERSAMSERERHDYEAFQRGLNEDLQGAGYSRLRPEVRRDVLNLMERGADANSAVENTLSRSEQVDRALGSDNPLPQGPVDMQTLELTRKRLNAMAQAATNDADRRAARHVIRAYDDWLNSAFDNALFMGSDDAIKAYKSARAANAEWRQRFGFNGRDDADKIINRIVTGEVTPQEVANYVVGASQVGAKGVSSRLLTRLTEATGGDPAAMQAIRGGVWNRLSRSAEGAAPAAADKIARDIYEFMNGSGRDVARRLFTPEQQGVMRAYADTIRTGQNARVLVADVAKATKPQPMGVGPGPMQELANTVLGKGGKTDEALFTAIDAYAKSGGRSDINTLATLVRNLPGQERGDLAGAVIRNLGVSPRTGQFSPDAFASQWKSYTPQAKAVLFGNAGPQRQAIDDIMTISERLKQVGQRFGNPSGTAQNLNLMAMASGFIAAPLTTLSAAVGGYGASKILSAPASASSAAKWARTYAAITTRPSAQTLAAYQVASRNLVNTANGVGANIASADFLRALQGPVASRAQDEQQ